LLLGTGWLSARGHAARTRPPVPRDYRYVRYYFICFFHLCLGVSSNLSFSESKQSGVFIGRVVP
jgi:hypothetical protein